MARGKQRPPTFPAQRVVSGTQSTIALMRPAIATAMPGSASSSAAASDWALKLADNRRRRIDPHELRRQRRCRRKETQVARRVVWRRALWN